MRPIFYIFLERPLLDRSRKLVGLQSLAVYATRVATPIQTLRAALPSTPSPWIGRGVHARPGRANRDVDIRRQFLG